MLELMLLAGLVVWGVEGGGGMMRRMLSRRPWG